jgi:hypothetical protein
MTLKNVKDWIDQHYSFVVHVVLLTAIILGLLTGISFGMTFENANTTKTDKGIYNPANMNQESIALQKWIWESRGWDRSFKTNLERIMHHPASLAYIVRALNSTDKKQIYVKFYDGQLYLATRLRDSLNLALVINGNISSDYTRKGIDIRNDLCNNGYKLEAIYINN